METIEDAQQEELLTMEQVVNFLHSKINIQNDICICHTLPNKTEKAKTAIIIRFISRKQRNNLLMQAKKLKGINVYIKKMGKKWGHSMRGKDVKKTEENHSNMDPEW